MVIVGASRAVTGDLQDTDIDSRHSTEVRMDIQEANIVRRLGSRLKARGSEARLSRGFPCLVSLPKAWT